MPANGSSTTFPDRGPEVLAVTTATLVIATVFVVARLVCRIGIVRNATLDDWFIVLAWFFAFGLCFAIDYGTSKGLGRHDADIPAIWRSPLRSCEYAFSVLYNPALMATKTSILIFYLRLSRNTNKLLRIASYVTLGIVNLAGIVLTFLSAFQCHPVSAIFDVTNSKGSCTPLVNFYLASAPVNIITDLAILVLPLPVLTGMNLPKKQKTILVATFGLGAFVAIVDVVRIYYLQQASIDRSGSALLASAPRLGDQVDFAYYASLALMWTAVEVNIGIICACIPTLKPLITRILPKLIHDHTPEGTEKGGEFMSPANLVSHQEHVDTSQEDHVRQAPAPVKELRSLPPHKEGGNEEEDEGGEMGFLDFLLSPGSAGATTNPNITPIDFVTTPDTDPNSVLHRVQTAKTTTSQVEDSSVYFGFVNMNAPRSMLKLKGREAFKYCTAVTILFFLWGFSYGLLNTLNGKIASLSKSDSASQSLGLQTAYFGAYLAGPLTVGRYVLYHGGFKATFITGLCIYGTGTLMFWPSAVLTSYAGFIVSNFVVAFGLSVLETAANPFLALCGPPDYAEMRLLLAQGVQGVGSVLSPLLATKLLFKNVNSGFSLIDVQWTYLAIAFFDVILALFFYYMPLPEATDADLEDAAHAPPQLPRHNLMTISAPSSLPPTTITIFQKTIRYATLTLALGVASQLLYVAGQEAVSINQGNIISSFQNPPLAPFDAGLVDHTLFTIGRFLAGALCLVILPRYLLLAFYLLMTITAILVTALSNNAAHASSGFTAILILQGLGEGPIFPLIFAISLRKLGRRTKAGAAYLTAAASGGAWFPWFVYLAQKEGDSVKASFVVIVVLFAVGCVFPGYLCAMPGARRQVDPWQGEVEGRPGSRRSFGKFGSWKQRKEGRESGDSNSGEGVTVEHREEGGDWRS